VTGLSPHERLHVVLVEARLAGIHPTWIEYARYNQTDEQTIYVLQAWMRLMELNKTITHNLSCPNNWAKNSD
jgi:hypothetical protein